MHIHRNYQTQFELFPGSGGSVPGPVKSQRLLKDLTLPLENIIVLGIAFVMALVLFYSFGVEKGKRLLRTSAAPVIDTSGDSEKNGIVSGVSTERVPAQKKPLWLNIRGSRGADNPPDVSVEAVQEPAVTVREIPREVDVSPQIRAGIRPQDQKQEVRPPAADTNSGAFTVQVASFKTQENAHREALRLKEKGFEIFVLSKGKHSIVCVGKFPRHDAAKEFLNKLKGRYNDCLVRRL